MGTVKGIALANLYKESVQPMSGLLKLIPKGEVRQYAPGEVVLAQGERLGFMLVLISGEVEVLRDDVCVATASEPGVVFGEMSILLDAPHSAAVRTRSDSTFAIIENPRAFLENNPAAGLYVAELLARRLQALTQYLIDVKRQYEGHDHLSMVDEVLETLIHRQPRRTQR